MSAWSSAGLFLHLARIQERGHGNIADGRHVIQTKPLTSIGGMAVVENGSLEHPRRQPRARRSTELASLLAGRDLVIAIVRETLRTVRSACFRHVPLGSLHIKRIVATGIGYIRRSTIRGLLTSAKLPALSLSAASRALAKRERCTGLSALRGFFAFS